MSFTAPRSLSSSGSHSLDLRQVKLAMTQQARRAASGGRVSTLKADTKSRLQSAKKSQSSTHIPPHKAETLSSQAKKVVSENGESTSRPKTWPLRVLEVSRFCFLMISSYYFHSVNDVGLFMIIRQAHFQYQMYSICFTKKMYDCQ